MDEGGIALGETMSRAGWQTARRLTEIVCGALFLWAAVVKGREGVDSVRATISGFQLLPAVAVLPFAYLLPAWEAVTGACLVLGWLRSGARATAFLLLCVFVVALGVAWSRGIVVDCGCFGRSVMSREAMAWAMARDAVMIAALWWSGRRKD
jgi:uncharacterized membrane protein YphA (DoxX/SURF4 family)